MAPPTRRWPTPRPASSAPTPPRRSDRRAGPGRGGHPGRRPSRRLRDHQGTLAADSNYTINFTGNTLTITPAPLTVTANPQTKVYGTGDPGLTVRDRSCRHHGRWCDDRRHRRDGTHRYPGPGRSGTAAGEQVGDYAITQGTLAANSDYAIPFTGSTLTITPATLTVTANPQTKVYGTADPALTDTAPGLVDTTVDG